MKKLTLTAATILTVMACLPASAQQQQAATTTSNNSSANVTVNSGPLFMNGLMNRIKSTFKRDTPQIAPNAVAAPRNASGVSASGSAGTAVAYDPEEAKQQAYWARNRAIADALNKQVAMEMNNRAMEIEAAKAADAAREAGQPVPVAPVGATAGTTAAGQVGVTGGVAPKVVYDKPVDTTTPKPIFNNYR